MDYRSSFSRAVELGFPTHRSLYVSGTASIDADGRTVHRDDAAAQIKLTMRVVEAILHSRDMGWGDLFRGTVYFRNMEDRALFDAHCMELRIPGFPLAVSHADICRDDLLFEIEVDAIKACATGPGSP